jgi:hypothetical protein
MVRTVKKFVIAVLILSVYGSSNAQAGSLVSARNDWQTEMRSPNQDEVTVLPTEVPFSIRSISTIQGTSGNGANDFNCLSIEDASCAGATAYDVAIVVPPCSATSTPSDVCIRNLKIANSGGQMVAASLDHEVNTQKTLRNDKFGIPRGGGISVWNSNSGAHAGGGTSYAVIVAVRIGVGGSVGGKATSHFVKDFTAEVVPFTYEAGEYGLLQWEKSSSANGSAGHALGCSDGSTSCTRDICVFTEVGLCALREEFQLEQRVSLEMQMDDGLTGWLFGRMKDFDISVKSLSTTTNLINVESTVIDVPLGYAWVPKKVIQDKPLMGTKGASSYDIPLYQFIVNDSRWFDGGLPWQPDYTPGKGWLRQIDPYLKPIPTRNSSWKLVATPDNFGSFGGCFSDKSKLHGVVTTNAMIYEEGAPVFKDGVLSYRVGGAHLRFDGELFRGTYDLAIRSESARCLYKFSKAPFRASVSVLSTDGGETSVATENVGERNGWFFLSAKNFTFSSPTIKVRLYQGSKAPVIPKKIQITCKKGKQVKKISGVSPTCPAGFKKA